MSGEFKEWTCQDFAGKGTRSSKMSYCDKSWKELNQDGIKSTGLISESCKLSCGSCSKHDLNFSLVNVRLILNNIAIKMLLL